MSTVKDAGLGNFITSLTDEQKHVLLDSLNAQLGIKPLKTVPVKKKAGRPAKVKKEVASKVSSKKKKIVVDDTENVEHNDKKLVEVDKILNDTRKPVKVIPRKPVKIIMAECKNCHRKIPVADNFPNLEKFVCCVK